MINNLFKRKSKLTDQQLVDEIKSKIKELKLLCRKAKHDYDINVWVYAGRSRKFTLFDEIEFYEASRTNRETF